MLRTTEDARHRTDDLPGYLAEAERLIEEASAQGLWGCGLMVPERLHYVFKINMNAKGYYVFTAKFPNGASTSKVQIFWSPVYQELLYAPVPEERPSIFRRFFK